MASTGRRSARDLIAEILAEGPRFGFFQAVRLLALGRRTSCAARAVPDSLRFLSKLSLAFPASQIDRVARRLPTPKDARTATTGDEREDGESGAVTTDSARESMDMTVGFMGLVGPSGVLPVAYTELLIDRRNQFRDGTAHAFLDMFTHRSVSLFYEAWRKYRFYVPHEAGHSDGFSRNILDVIGLGLHRLQHRLQAPGGGVPDLFLIHYAGLLSQRPIPPVNIEAIVRGFFGVEARLEQFVGQWMKLPENEQSALINNRDCILGQSSFLGERIWDRQNKMRLRLGLLDGRQFARFMPGQQEVNALRELIRFCSGLTLDYETTLVLKRDHIPPPTLRSTQEESCPRLGYTLWLKSQPSLRDPDDVRFALLKESMNQPQ